MSSPRIGRPPSDNPRRNSLPVRLSDDELAVIREAAESAGKTASEYMREKSLNAAKRSK